MNLRMAALAAAAWVATLPAQLPDADAVGVWCGSGSQLHAPLAPVIDAHADGVAWTWCGARDDADLWLAAPLVELWTAAKADQLAHRGAWEGVAADAVEPAGRFAVRFREPWGLAWAPSLVADPPDSVEDLLWQARFDRQVALPTALAAPELWDGWRATLGAAFGRDKAQAWLTRLDGRVAEYADDVSLLLPRLRVGEVGLLPEFVAAGAADIEWVPASDGAPRRSLGLALTVDAAPEASGLLDRLVLAEAEVAQAIGCALIEPGAYGSRATLEPGQRVVIDRWWRTSVQGRGVELETLDSWLDVILGVVLAAILFGIYLSIRRREAAT